MKTKKLLVVVAHPDDEVFGPGGSIAKYSSLGVEIHLLCATHGESGQSVKNNQKEYKSGKTIHLIREKELLKSAEILGIKKVEFLDFIDGYLSNAIYHKLAGKIIRKIKSFKPQVIMTMDRSGISGHLDHIAVSLVTTYSYLKTSEAQKLYYLCLPKAWYDERKLDYFIYFPEGVDDDKITTRIQFPDFWEIKKKAMKAHKSQIKDVRNLLQSFENWPKIDNYILQYHRRAKVEIPENDLFSGI